MEQNNFFLGSNYSNRDARSGWSLCPVQDIDKVLTNRYGMNVNGNVDDTFSLLYCDLYFRRLKEELKHTMLVHESVFESQIHELHRLYRRQKELMMEMEGTRHHEALYLNSSFHGHRTNWLHSSVSTCQTRNLPYEVNIPNQNEAVCNVEKFEKKVLDLELSVFEDKDMNGEDHELPNSQEEQSLESGKQSNRLQLDLNEPAKIEEHPVLNQFCISVTSNEVGEAFNRKNEGEDSAKGFQGMNEAHGQPSSVKCQEEYGIDLNVSLLSSEEGIVVNNLEIENPQASLSASLHGKYGSEKSRVIVQALPCLNSTVLPKKRYKPFMRGSRKKVKLGSSNNTFKGSDFDLHPSAQATSESHSNQASMEQRSSSSLSKVKSARKRSKLGEKRHLKPQKKSSNVRKRVLKRGGRTKRKKSRRISLVTEGNYQETSAAEAIVNISRKSGQETCEWITSLSSNLLWLAEISSLVVEDYELDYSEGITLKLTEMELEEQTIIPRKNSDDNKTAVSSIVLGKQRSSRARQGKRKCRDDQHIEKSSFSSFSEFEAIEDLQVVGMLTEASESKCDYRFPNSKSKGSPPKSIDAFTSSVEEKTGVDWGAIKKRKRGSRIPATEFQQMVINQVV